MGNIREKEVDVKGGPCLILGFLLKKNQNFHFAAVIERIFKDATSCSIAKARPLCGFGDRRRSGWDRFRGHSIPI
jgi:hypothetical protein